MQLIPSIAGALKTAVGTAGGAFQVGGTILSTGGLIAGANSASKTAKWNANRLEEQGKAEFAAASLEAEERRRETELVQSRARAVGAASGGGIDYDLMGDLEEEGQLRVDMAIWEGEEALKGRRNQAAAERFSGKSRKRAGLLTASRTLLGGGASIMEKYA